MAKRFFLLRELRKEKERQDIARVLTHELGHAVHHTENEIRGWIEAVFSVAFVGAGIGFLRVYMRQDVLFVVAVFAFVWIVYFLLPAERRADKFAEKHWIKIAKYVLAK